MSTLGCLVVGAKALALMVLLHSPVNAQVTWRESASFDNVTGLSVDCAASSDCALLVQEGITQRVLMSRDGGQTWTAAYTDSIDNRNRLPLILYKIQHPTRELIIVGADSGTVIRSTDRGTTWSRIVVAQPDNRVRMLSMADDRFGIVALAGPETPIAVTSDGGATWSALAVERPSSWDSLSRYPLDVLCYGADAYAIAYKGPKQVAGMIRTSDGGVTWSVIYPLVPEHDSLVVANVRFAPIDSLNFFVSTNRYVPSTGFGASLILHTTDAGQTWQIAFDPRPDEPDGLIATSFADPLHGVGASLNSLYLTEDGGHTWSLDEEGAMFLSDVYARRGHPWLALSRSSGVVYVRAASSSVRYAETMDPRAIPLVEVSNTIMTIRNLGTHGSRHAAIYDLTGRCLISRAIEPNEEVVQINMGHLSVGLYLLDMTGASVPFVVTP